MSVAIGMAHPALAASSPSVMSDEDQRGNDHAAGGGDHGEDGLGPLAQGADDEFALELEPGDEEEDGEQPVRRPRLEGQVEVERCRPDDEVLEVLVGVAPGGVGDDQPSEGGR